MSLRSLNSIAGRNLARRRSRFLLTACGVALGVAVLFAVQVMSSVTSRALNRAVHGGAGRADVSIGPLGEFDAVLAPGTTGRVRRLPDVDTADASTNFRTSLSKPGSVRSINRRPDFAFVTGVDLALDRTVHTYDLRAGRLFRPGAREIVLGHHIANRVGVGVGDNVVVDTPRGQAVLPVVGVLAASGVGTAGGGDVGFTSVPVAQALLGKGDVTTAIDVVLRPGTNVDRWISAERLALGNDISMVKSTDADAGFRSFITTVNGSLTLGAAIALFVGGFLIFLTFSLAVAERTRTYGTMRALGALPRQISRIVVVEAALLGLASSVGGLVLGYGLAAAATRLVSSLLFLTLPGLGVPGGPAVISVLIGVVVSVVAAWLPGRRAARLSPVAAMREGAPRDQRAGRPLIGAALIAIGVVFAFVVPTSAAVRGIPTLLVLFGAVLLVPILLRPLAAFVGAMTRRLARGVGAIAVMHLVKERSRSAYTLAMVMVVLAMIIAIGTSNVSMSHTVDRVVERQAGGAIQVSAAAAFDPAVDAEIKSVPGVRATSALRFGNLEILDHGGTRSVFFTVIDPASYFTIASFSWIRGDDQSVKTALTRSGAIVLPEAQAISLGVSKGETIRVRTSSGVRPFTVAGTFAEIGNFPGPAASIADAGLFGTGRPNAFLVSVKSGADPEVVRAAIASRLRPRYDATVDTTAVVRRQAHAQLQGFFGLAYALLFVAGLVGILGLANTIVVSVLARTREVGMLRSMGVLRRQARAMVLIEASTLALVAYLLALPLGWLLSTGFVVSLRSALGFTIVYVFPWLLVPVLVLVALIVAGVASLIPARRIGRLAVVEALRFD